MNIVRKYKLHLLNYNTLTDKELSDLNIIFKKVSYCKENEKLINYIYNNLLNLKTVKIKGYSNSIFLFKETECIFEFMINTKTLYYLNIYNLNIIKLCNIPSYYFEKISLIYENEYNKEN